MTISERIFGNAADSAVVDWAVLLAGGALLALSVTLTIATSFDSMTGDTAARVQSVEDWHPS